MPQAHDVRTFRRILVVGGNGSGKTTFAAALAEKTGLPLTHVAALCWHEGWTGASPAEFDALMQPVLDAPWIIDGNNLRSLPKRLRRAELVILFGLPRRTCVWGCTRRQLRNLGRTRPDLRPDCPEHIDLKFLRHVWRNHSDMR